MSVKLQSRNETIPLFKFTNIIKFHKISQEFHIIKTQKCTQRLTSRWKIEFKDLREALICRPSVRRAFGVFALITKNEDDTA